MKALINPPRPETRLLAIAVTIVCLPLFAALVSAQEAVPRRFTDPAAIDSAVAEFAGANVGETGGARLPSDRRLRLAACPAPLAVDWHGAARASVAVACPGPQGWRIFIAMNTPQPAAASAPAIKRGDPVTVVVRGRGFTVQQTGEAMEPGVIGDWIAIRTERQADPIRARIERPGLAIIPVG